MNFQILISLILNTFPFFGTTKSPTIHHIIFVSLSPPFPYAKSNFQCIYILKRVCFFLGSKGFTQLGISLPEMSPFYYEKTIIVMYYFLIVNIMCQITRKLLTNVLIVITTLVHIFPLIIKFCHIFFRMIFCILTQMTIILIT